VACSATEVAYSIVAIIAIKILLAQVRVDVISEIRDVWHIVMERAEGEPIMPFATRLRLHIGSQATPGISVGFVEIPTPKKRALARRPASHALQPQRQQHTT
jgi:hypothetical protein